MTALFVPALLLLISTAAAEPPNVQVSEDGTALLPILLHETADEEQQSFAKTLANHLDQITGGTFVIETDAGQAGIVLGSLSQYPDSFGKHTVDLTDPLQHEQYILRTTDNRLLAIGAKNIGLDHAVWDLLHQFGYRYYFQHDSWEIIPSKPTLTIAIDKHEAPDYHVRRIWYGYGTWDFNKKDYAEWCRRNRMNSDFGLSTGHAYGSFHRRNEKYFEAHPEYLGMLNGKRTSLKFCSANRELRELYEADAIAELEARPDAESISVDPTDGGNWCECDKCISMKSITNRAVTLANHVAAGIEERLPGKYVGMYAYNEHAPAPTISVHPKVIISTATAFLRGRSIESIINGWKDAGVTMFGIREYYDVNTWSRNLPGRARGSDIEYLKRTIRDFHESGAAFMSAESGECFGPNGLGYYLAARMLWDVEEADKVDALTENFLTNCFPNSTEPMRKFYKLIDGSNRPTLSDDLVGRMYRLLDEARKSTNDSAELERISQLILYTRYVEMYRIYSDASGEQRQVAFESLLTHIYRFSRTGMVHTYAIFRDLDSRDKSVVLQKEEKFQSPEGENPLKSTETFAGAEIDTIVTEGIAKNQLLAFEPRSFSNELIPPPDRAMNRVKPATTVIRARGNRTFYTWLSKPNEELTLTVTGGLIAHYRDRGDAQVKMYSDDHVIPEEPVATGAAPPDGEPRRITLKSPYAGLHKITVSDGGDLTSVSWERGTPMAIETSEDSRIRLNSRWTLYVYVPKGTRVIGGYSTIQDGFLTSPDYSTVHKFGGPADFFSIKVPRGQDGCLWEFRNCAGTATLLTIPPFLFRDHDEVLLPKELVEAMKK